MRNVSKTDVLLASLAKMMEDQNQWHQDLATLGMKNIRNNKLN